MAKSFFSAAATTTTPTTTHVVHKSSKLRGGTYKYKVFPQLKWQHNIYLQTTVAFKLNLHFLTLTSRFALHITLVRDLQPANSAEGPPPTN